jgi:hypothetical protein
MRNGIGRRSQAGDGGGGGTEARGEGRSVFVYGKKRSSGHKARPAQRHGWGGGAEGGEAEGFRAGHGVGAGAKVRIVVVGELRASPQGATRDADHDGEGRVCGPVPGRRKRRVLTAVIEQGREVWRGVAAQAGQMGIHIRHDDPRPQRGRWELQEVARRRGG